MLVIDVQQHCDVDDVSELGAYAVRAIEHDHWDRLLLKRALGQALSGLEVDIRQWAGSSGRRGPRISVRSRRQSTSSNPSDPGNRRSLPQCRPRGSHPLAAAPASWRAGGEVRRGQNPPGQMAQRSWIQHHGQRRRRLLHRPDC